MGVATPTEEGGSMEATQGTPTPPTSPTPPTAPPALPLYPNLSTLPPPYSPVVDIVTTPNIQAPVFVVQGGKLQGKIKVDVEGGHLLCEDVGPTPAFHSTPGEQEGSRPFPTESQGPRALRTCAAQEGPPPRQQGSLHSKGRPQRGPSSREHSMSLEQRGAYSREHSMSLEHRGVLGNEDIRREYLTSVNQPEEQEEEDEDRLCSADIWEASHQLEILTEAAEEHNGPLMLEGVFRGRTTPLRETERRSNRLLARRLREEEKEEHDRRKKALDKYAHEMYAAKQMPLRLDNGSNREEYVPWKMQDLTALMEQLPSLHGGASAWLLQLQTLTSGVRMALGDMKATSPPQETCPSNTKPKWNV